MFSIEFTDETLEYPYDDTSIDRRFLGKSVFVELCLQVVCMHMTAGLYRLNNAADFAAILRHVLANAEVPQRQLVAQWNRLLGLRPSGLELSARFLPMQSVPGSRSTTATPTLSAASAQEDESSFILPAEQLLLRFLGVHRLLLNSLRFASIHVRPRRKQSERQKFPITSLTMYLP
jgi:hypothetical protein